MRGVALLRAVQQLAQHAHVGLRLSVVQVVQVAYRHPCEVGVLVAFLILPFDIMVDNSLLSLAAKLPCVTQSRSRCLYLLSGSAHMAYALCHIFQGPSFEVLVVGGRGACLFVWAASPLYVLQGGDGAGLGQVHEIFLNLLLQGHKLRQRGAQ